MKKEQKSHWYKHFKTWFIKEYGDYLKGDKQKLTINPIKIRKEYNTYYGGIGYYSIKEFKLEIITKWLKNIVEEFNMHSSFEESDSRDKSIKPIESTNNTESDTLNIVEFKSITFNNGVIEMGNYIISGTFTLQLKSN